MEAVERQIDVAAGLIFRTGKLLITQRRPDDHLGGLWEFPGGKVEAGETFEACLHRELKEEVGIRVCNLTLFEVVIHQYPVKKVHLRFFRGDWSEGDARPLGCASLAWVGRQELGRYSFPDADTRLLARLEAESELWR